MRTARHAVACRTARSAGQRYLIIGVFDMAMSYDDFYNWIVLHCPPDRDHAEFIERLAIGSIIIIEKAAENTGHTIHEILDRFVWNDNEVMNS